VTKSKTVFLTALCFALITAAGAQQKEPLKLLHSIPVPGLHDGDFDHFVVDLPGTRLFATAEENSKVLVFDLRTNKLIHSLDDLKAPHSMAYRGDLKKLFVVDGDLGEIKIYNTDTYKPEGTIKVREGADSSTYDPSTKYLYVVNGGKDAKLPNAYISIIDTTTGKQIADVKMDTDDVEAMALEKSGPRLFADLRGSNAVAVLDRKDNKVVATWPIAEQGKKPTTIAYDEANHRLFVGTRDPGKLLVLDSESGKLITSLPAVAMVDDMIYDKAHKRIYFAGSEFTDVFVQRDPDHYEHIAHVPTAFRAKTAILLPERNEFILAVPHHEKQIAEVRIYQINP